MDPALKVQAFDLLVNRYFGKPTAVTPVKAPTGKAASDDANSQQEAPDTSDLGAFISSFETEKPSDALNVLIAWLYSQNGAQPFTVSELKTLADSCGLTIPARSDMTLRQSKSDKKAMFTKSGGGWKLTVSGELHYKRTYQVTKGTATTAE